MRWLKGLIFFIVAVVSLAVVLFWPHESYKASKFDKNNIPPNVLTDTPPMKTYTPRGLPFIWIEEVDDDKLDIFTIIKSNNPDTREIKSTNLLINLIFWAVFLFFVEMTLRGFTKRRNK